MFFEKKKQYEKKSFFIILDIIQTFCRIAQSRQSESYGLYKPLFGVAEETFFVDNELCSEDPYAYNSCSKYDDFIDLYNQFAQSRQERNFQFTRPTCRKTCF